VGLRHLRTALGRASDRKLIAGGAILAATFFWAYWPTLKGLVHEWDTQPDYSHGYLVVPLAVLFLWVRRDRFPGLSSRVAWEGVSLVVLSLLFRVMASLFYLGSVDEWSIVLWVSGVVWMLGGWRLFCWALPSIAFLFFMMPLPFSIERWFSLPLQKVATHISCAVLQFLGQPALAAGTTIHFGPHELEVERACCGLRIFMGILALAYAYLVVVRQTWWERAVLIASVIPVALIANSTRIVITTFFYPTLYPNHDALRSLHDYAGLAMIPYAASLFGLVILLMRLLFPRVEGGEADIAAVVQSKASKPQAKAPDPSAGSGQAPSKAARHRQPVGSNPLLKAGLGRRKRR